MCTKVVNTGKNPWHFSKKSNNVALLSLPLSTTSPSHHYHNNLQEENSWRHYDFQYQNSAGINPVLRIRFGKELNRADLNSTTRIWIGCVYGCVSCSVMPDSATPWIATHQAPLSMEFSRQEDWSGLPFPSPGDLPNPGTEPRYSVLWADSWQSWATREALWIG